MKLKDVTRYGKKIFTTIEPSDLPDGQDSKLNRLQFGLWESENNVAKLHTDLRYTIRSAIDALQAADKDLERNCTNGVDISKLLNCVNTLGILQGKGPEVDMLVRALDAAVRQHKMFLSAVKED